MQTCIGNVCEPEYAPEEDMYTSQREVMKLKAGRRSRVQTALYS